MLSALREAAAGITFAAVLSQLRRLGASCDWSRERFTLDEDLSRGVAEAFVRLHDKGLIYRGAYMVNWSPALQTAVSDIGARVAFCMYGAICNSWCSSQVARSRRGANP